MSRGYLSIPNQPIIFKPESELNSDCSCTDGGYSQLVDFDDEIFTQFEAVPCGRPLFNTGEPEFVNDCTTNGFTITKDNDSVDWGAIYFFYQYMQYDVIKIVITVSSIEGSLLIFDGISSFEITTVGEHIIYLPNNYFDNTFIPIGVGGIAPYPPFQGVCTIESVEGVPAGGIFLGLVDATTLETVELITPIVTRVDNILTVGFNVSDLTIDAGCYRIAMADYCTNTCGQYYVQNPFFNCDRSGVPFWTQGLSSPFNQWIIDCNIATADITTENGFAYMLNTIELCAGVTYSITIEVGEFTFGNIEAGILIFDGTNYNGQSVQISANENFTFTATFTATDSGQLAFGAFQTGFGSGIIEITYVQIRATQETATYDHYSDVLNIGDFDNSCEFFKIEGCNAEDQLGMYFTGTSFLPGIRLAGRRFHPQYDLDLDIFRYASGRYQTTYADRKKRWRFNFGRLPEYVLDFLSIVFYFDKTYINGEIYVPSNDRFPEIQYEDADDYGALDIDLYKQDDKIRKTICAASDPSCLPSILGNTQEPFLLTQGEERIVAQNGVNIYYQN